MLMTVKLILATGSHAGMEETLKPGYYMIGRHEQCQIRPKSRSVSRRHCLLHPAPDASRRSCAKIDADRANMQRDYEINRQLSRMMRRRPEDGGG